VSYSTEGSLTPVNNVSASGDKSNINIFINKGNHHKIAFSSDNYNIGMYF
jgi:hypothetical protein